MITAAQVKDHPSRSVGILGIAAGNGLDEIDATEIDAVYGYDSNPDYLGECQARYASRFRDRLHLVECSIDRTHCGSSELTF